MKILNAAVLAVFIPASLAVADEAGKSKIQETQILLAEIGRALDMYYTDCGAYPLDLKYLVIPPPNCKNWGPDSYIKEVSNDPWGKPLKYRLRDPQNYELRSLGADGVEGGEDENMDVSL
jgi:general secretion pathway protein G